MWIAGSIWLSLAFAFPVYAAWLARPHRFPRATNDRWFRMLRGLWSLALVMYLAHVIFAFHSIHEWSHTHAFEHVQRESGFGPGIYITYTYITYTYTLAWLVEVMAWWVMPWWIERRPSALTHAIFAAFLFIVLNGAVVFARGWSLIIGLVWFGCLGGVVAGSLFRGRLFRKTETQEGV